MGQKLPLGDLYEKEPRDFTVFYVWENDFRQDKEATVEHLMRLIYD